MKKYLYEDLYLLEEKHWWHISKRRVVKELISKYNKKNSKLTILDIGCGTGKNLEELEGFGKVFGLDNSKEALRFCQKRGLKNLTLGNAEEIPFPSNSFDIVTVLDLLEHVDDEKCLKEINRVLQKDGLVILTVPAYPQLWSKWDDVLHHKKRYTKNSLTEIIKLNNFKLVKITYLYSFLVVPVLIVRKVKNFFTKNAYPSDFKLSNHMLNSLFEKLSDLEFQFAEKFSIPFGTSILSIAKKK